MKHRAAHFALLAGLFALASLQFAALAAHRPPHRDETLKTNRPWIEGVDPVLENQLFDATYRVLPSHNVLKIYMEQTSGYESGGIRFSARIAHRDRDLTLPELDREAVSLIRTTFEQFPNVQALDVWATIPVPQARQAAVENTVFSVSANRSTYELIRAQKSLSDVDFLAAFGHVWASPALAR
ncbi:MAG: hypothetical protein GIX02_03325 [Candidatus Eremiobacteraeota bacterium]|nr:hypothetical protein [Candidatus Eremiobacteraeota bacterium]